MLFTQCFLSLLSWKCCIVNIKLFTSIVVSIKKRYNVYELDVAHRNMYRSGLLPLTCSQMSDLVGSNRDLV